MVGLVALSKSLKVINEATTIHDTYNTSVAFVISVNANRSIKAKNINDLKLG